jgi:PAS domain S-box-containing protein
MRNPDGRTRKAGSPAVEGARPPSTPPSPTDLARFWDLSLAMMGVGDYDGYFTLVNSAYQELLGWSVEELMSVPYWEFVHPEDRDAMVESGQDLIDSADGSRFGYEVRMLCRDGHYRWTRWNTRAIPQEQLLYTIAVDISDIRGDGGRRVLAGSWDCDLRAWSVRWSQELHGLFGVTDGEAIGYEAYLDRIHASDRQRVDRKLRATAVDGEEFIDDFRVQDRDGRIRWVHAAGRTLRARGEPHRVRGIAIDITDTPPGWAD